MALMIFFGVSSFVNQLPNTFFSQNKVVEKPTRFSIELPPTSQQGITAPSWDERNFTWIRLLTPSRDMAKIGQSILNKGKWDGERIVNEKWIE